MYREYFVGCIQDGTVKLWNYQRGEILDDIDCSAHVAATVDSHSDVSSDSCHKSTDIRCMTSSHRLLAVSFNGYHNFCISFAMLLLCK